MSPNVSVLMEAAQYALVIGGLASLWRFGLSAAARRSPALLAPWGASPTDFFLFLWLVISGGLIAPFAAGAWLKQLSINADFRLIVTTAVFQLGLLAGVLVFRIGFSRLVHPAPLPPATWVHSLLAGAATFLAAMPVIVVVSLAWQGLLKACHIPAPPQDAIDVLRHAKDPLPLIILLVSAILVAPISEELIFRAGIFRFVRTRLPRWAALLLPACIFSAMHTNLASFAPLVALGVVFALAYERTGRISTTIVAHALFNLTTTVLILSGVNV